MALVELRRFFNPVEAELARLRLASAGIDSVIFDDQVALYIGAASGIRLMVLDEDKEEAGQLLDE
jgi:hypothetical protein